ncbi:Thioredoxin-like [Pedobacter sp. ok626]|uniref:thioredoxin family protein n=1 Tax=Pedobacter sp. ok626 TaxID=1761882 RepID=UPI00088939B1|nr:thioredoxin family protein [Pedobacter sp. ok626]SDK09765.1 Thioredoxin-like [Pedobacter sp. ok626]
MNNYLFRTSQLIGVVLFLTWSMSNMAYAQNRRVDLKENLAFDDVLKMAKEKNKLIFLDFGSITCKPCLYIKKEVLTLDSVADFINERFVSVDYNVGKEKDRLRKLYKVEGEPVLLIMDQNGVLMHRMAGKVDGQQLMQRFKQGLDPKNNFVALSKSYAEGNREAKFVLKYLEALHNASETEKMNQVVSKFLEGPVERIKDPDVWKVFYKFNQDLASREMMYMFDNRLEFYKLFGQSMVEGKINKLYSEKSIFYLYGHKPPIDDPKFSIVLNYARKTDYPKATEWLCYLVPAEHKYKDWTKVGQEVDQIYSFNILKGRAGSSFKDMMVTQFIMYCNDGKALQYPIRWCDELIAERPVESEQKRLREHKKSLQERALNPEKDKLNWTDMN